MKFKICIFRQHFFVNANFVKHNRHFMSTYFLLDPFEYDKSNTGIRTVPDENM